MCKKTWIIWLSQWQCNANKNHPLLCQVGTKVAAALILLIPALFGWLWLQAKPILKNIKTAAKTYEVAITNEGILPAKVKYQIISSDAAIFFEPVVEGGQFITFRDTTDNKRKILEVTDLPGKETVKVSVIGSDTVTVLRE